MIRPVKKAKIDDSIACGISLATRAIYGIDMKAIEKASLKSWIIPTKTTGGNPK